MKQYLKLLEEIKEKGCIKPYAREFMPSTQSLFGYQFRHNLADGFPILTTKEISFKNIVIELLWFLRGDTNIKYLIDNGCNIWNEDAYNYYCKLCKEKFEPMSFELFINKIRSSIDDNTGFIGGLDNYKLGDCGYQYGKVWRNWGVMKDNGNGWNYETVDQISNLINGLKNNPESRRHILTSIDPAHEDDLALYWCHALSQFNCRPLSEKERDEIFEKKYNGKRLLKDSLDEHKIPKYYLDCQMYQRSADVFLGVPYNIASYALLTHIFCELCNMIPGEMIYSYGDVHIYENHKEQVDKQLERVPQKLPKLKLSEYFKENCNEDFSFNWLRERDFTLENYNPQSKIFAKLSTGLK